MANSQESELLGQKIKLKIADGVEEVVPDLVQPPAPVLSELGIRWWAEKAKNFGPILLTLGLAFSFVITLLAIVYMPLVSLGGKWLFG